MILERPLVELTQDAIRILYRELGVSETVRFLRQFTIGYGNYMEERDALLGNKTLPELLEAMKRQQQAESVPTKN